jgi:hypothetical protein
MNNIKNEKEKAKEISNKQSRKKKEKERENKEQQIMEQIKQKVGFQGVEEWLLNGIIYFIDTFISNKINLRIYPFNEFPHLQILSNLKREFFVDTDIENILFAYSSRPNIKLEVFGLITSMPSLDQERFDLDKEYSFFGERITDEVSFEKGFRAIFDSMESFEKFVRFSRYPNITVYPIAIYRRIGD